jgi:large subunit GTPase 1
VTQERALDEFLSTAELAGTDFTAGADDMPSLRCRTYNATERLSNVKVVPQSANAIHNPYLLTEQEEKKTLEKQSRNRQRLRVPRRPPWDKSMTSAELDRLEKDTFLDWRRGLAQ